MLCSFSSPEARRVRNHTHFISVAAGGLCQLFLKFNNKINLIVMPVCGQESVTWVHFPDASLAVTSAAITGCKFRVSVIRMCLWRIRSWNFF